MFWFLVVFLFGVCYGLVLGLFWGFVGGCYRALSAWDSAGWGRDYGLMGFSADWIWFLCGSSHSGSVNVFPRWAGGSSMVKPGPLVAISRRTPESSRK